MSPLLVTVALLVWAVLVIALGIKSGDWWYDGLKFFSVLGFLIFLVLIGLPIYLALSLPNPSQRGSCQYEHVGSHGYICDQYYPPPSVRP